MSMFNVHSFSCTSNQQVFFEHLQCAKPCARCLGCSLSCLRGACNLVKDVDKYSSQGSAPIILSNKLLVIYTNRHL